MKNKLATALSVTAVILATGSLSGCGDGNKELDAWAKTVCDQAAAQVKKINDANTDISNTPSDAKPQEVKSADSAAFGQISDAYKALAGIVGKAGDPPVDNGAGLKKDAVGDLNSLGTAYANLRQQVEALPVSDQAKFADGLKGVSDNLAKVSKSGEQALDTLRRGEVGQAMAKQPGCQDTGASPSKS
ncbi:small secreted protein [Streptomyces sp. ME01-24h]|nr:small secreted protein [Streptomyces sp. ME19-03-3]MDX3214792.1 small secreted protein [Streptomyces sp. ME02-6991-2B]MDX3354112.1 small secreted protein [Streptomyces sp. ME01-24h]